jgi:N utilization substance protein A
VSSITIEDNKAIVTLPADQKSKAIGRSGINIRLASMLTGFEIELIQSDEKTSQEEQAQNSKSQNKGSSIDALEALFNK